jgi:dihydrofolate synthase/folylpolyglutamate synthase
VGLEHTRWLGPTLKDIAEEKLAVLARGTTLVLGPDLAPAAQAVAARLARERAARIERAEQAAQPLVSLRARGAFQRANFALARTAARVYLEGAGLPVLERALVQAAAQTTVRGRMQLVSEDPPTLLDAAHNPHAVKALVESLGDMLPARPRALVLGVLDDKDAAAMLEMLLGVCERAWFTAPASPRALPPAALLSRARQLEFEGAASEPEPRRALDEAQRWARAHGGAVLVTGSVYLIGDLLGALEHGGAGARDEGRQERAR